MMKSFMISGSLTRGMELDEDPSGSDAMPFPGEDVVMTVYGGRLPLERRHVSKLSPGPNSLWFGTRGHRGVRAQIMCVCVCLCVCVSVCVCVCVYVNLYIMAAPKEK
jgi:hypothetical protein